MIGNWIGNNFGLVFGVVFLGFVAWVIVANRRTAGREARGESRGSARPADDATLMQQMLLMNMIQLNQHNSMHHHGSGAGYVASDVPGGPEVPQHHDHHQHDGHHHQHQHDVGPGVVPDTTSSGGGQDVGGTYDGSGAPDIAGTFDGGGVPESGGTYDGGSS